MKNNFKKKLNVMKKQINSISFIGVANSISSFHDDTKVIGKNIKNKVNQTKGYALNPLAPFALVFNVAPWKRDYIRNYLPDYKIIFVGLTEDLDNYQNLLKFSNVVIIVWGRSVLAHIQELSNQYDLPLYHLEDGFIRSIGLGANHIAPMSICFDKNGLYFDSGKPSDLEEILNNYDFESDSDLMNQAQQLMDKVINCKISKYNLPDTELSAQIYGPKVKKRILVIGQVEDDQSLIYGCEKIPSNLDLLKLALEENPKAQIIYKIHPDILYGKRKEISDITELKDSVSVLDINLSLFDALNQVDRVYTMTSLAGFEALMHGVPVTTIGAPFYSGWGLTDDRYHISRRLKKLSLLEVFAASYILYPRYRTVDSFSSSNLANTIDYIVENKTHSNIITPEKKFAYLSFYNMQTMMRVDNRLITKLNFKNVAFISDSIDSSNIAQSIAESSSIKVSLLNVYDPDQESTRTIIPPKVNVHGKKIYIESIYQETTYLHNKIEQDIRKITTTLVDSLYSVLKSILANLMDEELLKHLSSGLAEKCYSHILKFLSMREALDSYDALVVHFEDSDLNKDIINSIQYYANIKEKENKVFLSTADKNPKKLIQDNESFSKRYLSTADNLQEIRTRVASFWYDINNEAFHESSLEGNLVLICGSLEEINCKQTIERTLEVVGKENVEKIIYFNDSFVDELAINNIRKQLLEMPFQSNTKVYDLTYNYFSRKYGDIYKECTNIFSTSIPRMVLSKASSTVPRELLNILEIQITDYCKSLQSMIALAVDIEKLALNASTCFTLMNQTTISKIIVNISNRQNARTVGLLPNMKPIANRNDLARMDTVGVPDSVQRNILIDLNYESEAIKNIGSISIINELIELSGCDTSDYDIYFELPLISEILLIPIIRRLKEIIVINNLRVIIKPNIKHVLPIYYSIRNELSDLANVRFLPRDSETNCWISRSKLVVGVLDTRLLIAAAYGKDVAIGYFDKLEHPLTYYKNLHCFNFLSGTDMEETVMGLLNKENIWNDLQKKKKQYEYANPQLKYPYTTSDFDKFIVSNLPSSNE
ncbi:hypothetical protein [Psychrobacter immobilis]|uniref:capsular polysaccharide export protein, LipB/KpsS family n=1 Tax=Psychrobacter immobilis TaxID=498 RepID=UPI0019182B6E|nr:hypothetical protein [Psychrobacter immobilis]